MRTSRLWLLLAACCLGGGATMPDPFAGTLHRLDKGRVARSAVADDVRQVALYYGASWCGPCRAFVPELIAAYPRLRAMGTEVIFVSDDRSCAAALDYARASRMPWLLLPCDAHRRRALRALGGTALPGLVVVDRDGRQRATSWRADDDSAPRGTLRWLLDRPPGSGRPAAGAGT
ncbi:MAG: alkyl hydroperoxide reductase/Thiol specific antioxidant/Mal allergen [Sphingomonas sp.]|nr:alkyl hydroperoxide reductase/Thiol specific antioxidant/Mal allergen [Sphingomonas sp.]